MHAEFTKINHAHVDHYTLSLMQKENDDKIRSMDNTLKVRLSPVIIMIVSSYIIILCISNSFECSYFWKKLERRKLEAGGIVLIRFNCRNLLDLLYRDFAY